MNSIEVRPCGCGCGVDLHEFHFVDVKGGIQDRAWSRKVAFRAVSEVAHRVGPTRVLRLVDTRTEQQVARWARRKGTRGSFSVIVEEAA